MKTAIVHIKPVIKCFWQLQKIVLSAILLTFIFPCASFSRETLEYDETSVFVNVQKVGSIEVSAIIINNEVYLPVTDIFTFLKIKNVMSTEFDSISGFFINQESGFVIDKIHNSIHYQEKVFKLDPTDLIQTETGLYLKLNYYGLVFGLEGKFNFRSLSIIINTELELPVIREMRQELIHRNVNNLKGEIQADTSIRRSYPLFHIGMVDWSVISTHRDDRNDLKFNVTLGSIIAGGETNISINYNKNQPFTAKQQLYRWRFVKNDFAVIRQVVAGKITTPTISSIFSPVIGIQLTNTPTTLRRSFGSYTISDYTKPGWTVELYINNVLVNYAQADASGFFTFEVPLVYGSSRVKLRFYSAWGEEYTREENISIPFNFLPSGILEYTVTTGIVESDSKTKFLRTHVNYGLSPHVTVGGGVEYLSSRKSSKIVPFINTSVRLGSNTMVSGEYVYAVKAKGILSYRMPSNIHIELNYTKYNKQQEVINNNYLEEYKGMVSVPIRGRKFTAFSRFTFNQTILPSMKSINAEWLFSATVKGVSANISTYALITGSSYIYSNVSLSLKLPKGFIFNPQAQYGYKNKELVSLKGRLEKSVFSHGSLNFSYEQNFKNKTNNIEIGLRYDFSFAQLGVLAQRNNGVTMLSTLARGSFIHENKANYFGANNRNSVGMGGVIVLPYLDLNCNGIRDSNEPKVAGLKLNANGGQIEYDNNDTTIRILNLEPYTSHNIYLDNSSLENISWQMKKKIINVSVDPNKLKLVEVPISVVGEVSGTVYLKKNEKKKGQSQIIICFYNSDSSLAGRVLTEQDGYFSFLGLAPGRYTIGIDKTQLTRLHMISEPNEIPITILSTREGDIVEGNNFNIHLLSDSSDATIDNLIK